MKDFQLSILSSEIFFEPPGGVADWVDGMFACCIAGNGWPDNALRCY